MMGYRIARTEFCDLKGEGAKQFGGRWNLPGYAAVYASSSVSSALLERLTIDPELFASERYVLYSVMEIDCPDVLIYRPPKAGQALFCCAFGGRQQFDELCIESAGERF